MNKLFGRLLFALLGLLAISLPANAQMFETYNANFGYINATGLGGGSQAFGSYGQSGSCVLTKTSNVTVTGAPTTLQPYQSFTVHYQIAYTTPGAFSGNFSILCGGSGGIKFGVNMTGTYVKPVTVRPLYKVLSILYDPPGNASSNGYSNATSSGTTTSMEKDFSVTDTTTYTYNGSILGIFNGGGSASFSVGVKSGNTSAFETDYSTSTGYQLGSVQQNIDHNQDQFFLWLNPEVTFYQSGSTSSGYTIKNVAGGSNTDIVNVNAAELKNPTTIPLTVLKTQNPAPGVTLPGLSSICATPLPDNQCTQANACGCKASDFTSILAEDPLIGSSQLTAPSTIDSNRFVYVDFVTLQGPANAGDGTVQETFTQTDSTLSSFTNSLTHTYSTGFSGTYGWGAQSSGTGFTMQISNTNTFEWDETQSYGSSNGQAHTANVTMGSSKVGCNEYVDIYEDTVYHTYSFALPSAPPTACQ